MVFVWWVVPRAVIKDTTARGGLSMSSDPTIEFLERLDRANEWVVVRNVPVFRAHKRRMPDGRLIEVSERDLEAIASNTRRLETESGVPIRITAGHTMAGEPQTNQPEIWGYARNARVGTFGPRATPAILVDQYIRRDRWDAARSMPYRSAEYYPFSKVITGVALLRTDPQLDLGMVTYAMPGRAVYAMENSNMPDPTMPPNKDEPLAAPAAPAAPEGVDPEFFSQFMKCWEFARQNYSAGFPGATNAAVPGTKEDDAQRMARDSEAIRYARLEAELAALRKSQKESMLRYARAESERIVTQLEAEGVVLDRALEVERMAGMDDAGREAHAAHIRRFYRSAPVAGAGMVALYSGPVEGAAAFAAAHATSDAERDAAVSLATKRSLSYNDALVEVRAAGRRHQ